MLFFGETLSYLLIHFQHLISEYGWPCRKCIDDFSGTSLWVVNTALIGNWIGEKQQHHIGIKLSTNCTVTFAMMASYLLYWTRPDINGGPEVEMIQKFKQRSSSSSSYAPWSVVVSSGHLGCLCGPYPESCREWLFTSCAEKKSWYTFEILLFFNFYLITMKYN